MVTLSLSLIYPEVDCIVSFYSLTVKCDGHVLYSCHFLYPLLNGMSSDYCDTRFPMILRYTIARPVSQDSVFILVKWITYLFRHVKKYTMLLKQLVFDRLR